MLWSTVRRNQQPSQSVSWLSSLPKTESRQFFMPSVGLYTEFSAVFPCHHSLERLHNRAEHCRVMQEGLGGVMYGKTRPLAKKLVISCFVYILKSSPATNVIDQNCVVGLISLHDILQELHKSFSVLKIEPTLALISVGFHDDKAVLLRINAKRGGLILQRELVMFM